MTRVKEYKSRYEVLKSTIITDIWSRIKDQKKNGESTEIQLSDALILSEYDPQAPEVIQRLSIEKSEVIAHAGVYEEDSEFNINELEVPMLIEIIDSIERQLE